MVQDIIRASLNSSVDKERDENSSSAIGKRMKIIPDFL